MAAEEIPLGITLNDLTDEERAHVDALMGPTFAVTKAKAIENIPQKLIFQQQAMILKKHFVNDPDVGKPIVAFHATARQNSGSIMLGGFDVSRAGAAHGTALGAGIYVATKPKFSNMYSKTDMRGDRMMFICDVLPGKNGTHSKKKGDQMVINRECQVLPRYLVYYTEKVAKKLTLPPPRQP